MKIQMNPNEMVVKAADSNFITNGSSIKGKLILTTQRIYFNPEINGGAEKHLEIYPDRIKEVMFFKDKILFPSGLNIVTKDGLDNKFTVKKRGEWSEMIARMF